MEKILIHTCCGPCSIMPLQNLLKDNFSPSAYFFNPNIHLQDEFLLRLFSMQEVAKYYNIPLIIAGNYDYFEQLRDKNTKIPNGLFRQSEHELRERGESRDRSGQSEHPLKHAQHGQTEPNEQNKQTKQRMQYKNAIAKCTEFLSSHKYEDKVHEEKMRKSIQKILTKWRNYTQEFSYFNSDTLPVKTFVDAPLYQNNMHNFSDDRNVNEQYAKTNHACTNERYADELKVDPMAWVAHLDEYKEGERCKICYQERLYQSALYAALNGYKSFTTTLLYSCYQNHEDICEAAQYAVEKVNKEIQENTLSEAQSTELSNAQKNAQTNKQVNGHASELKLTNELAGGITNKLANEFTNELSDGFSGEITREFSDGTKGGLSNNLANAKPISFYYDDFRKGWQEGINLSKDLGLYRQKWCGCALSRIESLERMAKREYEEMK